MKHDAYRAFMQKHQHMLQPSTAVISTAIVEAKAHLLQPEALLIFSTTDYLIRAEGDTNAWLSYCQQLWVQAKA